MRHPIITNDYTSNLLKELCFCTERVKRSIHSAPLDPPGPIDNDIKSPGLYQPEKPPVVPILIGEKRCDSIYHGTILPCLLRPELPPFSYSTEVSYNTEYRKKK
nr:uncharacterized protein LOC121128875 [Lepeophtheirus salmonis]